MGFDLAAVLQLADRKSLTIQQVELNVLMRQSLGEGGYRTHSDDTLNGDT